VIEKLIQSWRYKTLAVKKRHKNHLSFFFQTKSSSTSGNLQILVKNLKISTENMTVIGL